MKFEAIVKIDNYFAIGFGNQLVDTDMIIF